MKTTSFLFSVIIGYSIYIILVNQNSKRLEMRKTIISFKSFVILIIFVQHDTRCNISLSVLLCTFIFYPKFFVCIYELCRSNCLLQFKVTTKIICRMGKLLFHWKEPWGEMEEKDNTWIYITQLCTFVFFH